LRVQLVEDVESSKTGIWFLDQIRLYEDEDPQHAHNIITISCDYSFIKKILETYRAQRIEKKLTRRDVQYKLDTLRMFCLTSFYQNLLLKQKTHQHFDVSHLTEEEIFHMIEGETAQKLQFSKQKKIVQQRLDEQVLP
jgi:hypothetical protein